MRFELYQSGTEWRWRLKGGNGEIIASGEGYTRKESAQIAVGLIMDTNRQTPFVQV